MTQDLSRRALIGTALAALAAPAGAAPAVSLRPRLRPRAIRAAAAASETEALIARARLSGEVGYAVMDAATGEMLEARSAGTALAPASVTKAITALYALDALGGAHRFATRLIATGPVEDGVLRGDLVLAGGGDPTLDTDALADMAAGLKRAGVREVTGAFRVWGGAVPYRASIDPRQPVTAGYNPALSGLNLNYNRVHFEWRRAGDGYAVSMDARSGRYRPDVTVARMRVADRRAPIYSYADRDGRDHWSVARGAVTAAAWYLFLLSLDRFLFPIVNLSAFWAQIQQGLSAAERVYALIDADPNLLQEDDEEVEQIEGRVRFEAVDFHYIPSEPILTRFNLLIEPGESLALVGHTGAGKSSIAKLIARFYEFQSGKLLVDGRDIRSFDLVSYRKQLGIVSQSPFLFSGTVAENIRYARPEATDAEILAMARQIGDGEWLETLPKGLESEVDERGSRLSMGQRQLVALMRVLVQNPAIFILDEATASIDPFTEWQIQQALNLILENTTSILIAHRLSTVKSADRILVMDEGAIIEEGNHDALLAQDGHYANLYNTYFRHQSLAYVENQGAVIREQ